MTDTVRYSAPVEVTVDLDAGTVVSVVVLDEEVALDDLSEDLNDAAVAIAENKSWPEWEIGR